jgi:hypothetical protein
MKAFGAPDTKGQSCRYEDFAGFTLKAFAAHEKGKRIKFPPGLEPAPNLLEAKGCSHAVRSFVKKEPEIPEASFKDPGFEPYGNVALARRRQIERVHDTSSYVGQACTNVVLSEGSLDDAGRCLVQWAVSGQKLISKDKQVVSPEVYIDVPGCGMQPFKIFIQAKAEKQKGIGFQKTKGRGRIELKCLAPHPSIPKMNVLFSIGSDAFAHPCRGPISHDFSQHNMCSLPDETEEWDFKRAVDYKKNVFTIIVMLELSS